MLFLIYSGNDLISDVIRYLREQRACHDVTGREPKASEKSGDRVHSHDGNVVNNTLNCRLI